MGINSRLLEIEKLIAKEEAELKEAAKITEQITPILNTLTKKDILNPVMLKTKLAGIDAKYRNTIYALFRVAVQSGSEGSFMILNPRKVLSFIQEN